MSSPALSKSYCSVLERNLAYLSTSYWSILDRNLARLAEFARWKFQRITRSNPVMVFYSIRIRQEKMKLGRIAIRWNFGPAKSVTFTRFLYL